MKMRERFAGTGQVFSFTLRQFLRSRANLLSVLFTVLAVLVSMPLMTYVQGGEVEEDGVPFASVGVSNQTDLTLDLTLLTQDEYWSEVTFLDPPRSADAGVNITFENGGYLVTVSAAEEGAEDALDRLQWDMVHCVDMARIAAAGITDAQLEILWSDYNVVLPWTEDPLPMPEEDMVVEVDGDGLMDSFWIQYGYAIAVMMLCLLSASYIIRAVIEEKGSKLIELLLLSVQPLALLTGKILAAMVYAFGMLLVLVAAWAGSLALTAVLFGAQSVENITSVLQSLLPALQTDGLHLLELALVLLVSLLLGYLTMGIIGGLSGACCSSMDDAGSASGTVTLITMAGYIGACAVGAVPGGTAALISSLCPILSMFCAPVRFVQGEIGWGVLALSWLIQLALVAALAWLSARVYADLVIHRGNRVKWKQLLAMARQRKEAAR